MTYEEVLEKLKALADPEAVAFKMKKFGVIANNALGVFHKDLKGIAKDIGKDNALAIKLFDSGIYEGRLLCSKIFDPKALNNQLLEKWVKTFENWEICDSFCMALIARSEFAIPKIESWRKRSGEFEKRAAFATMAAYCMADKKAPNEVYERFFPYLIEAATDDRLYVKKAVNWALRSIGKRNRDLLDQAIKIAEEIHRIDHKTAHWIAKDALREFHKAGLRISDYPRAIYRP